MTEQIGSKIKHLRTAAGISIEELAGAAGINDVQMRLIESDELMPSISTLIKLSRRIGVRLGTILDGEEHPGPAVTRQGESLPTVSTSNSNTTANKHLMFYALAEKKRDRNMEPYMVDVEYVEPDAKNMSNHEGEEFIYVLDGEIELRYGSEVYRLSQGDSIYYDSLVPHCVSTPAGGRKARMLAVIYIPY